MYNVCIAGAAGMGIETIAAILERRFRRNGYYVFAIRDVMSRVRGGANFTLLRIDTLPVHSHCEQVDVLAALNLEGLQLHRTHVKEGGYILCDTPSERGSYHSIDVEAGRRARELRAPHVGGSIFVGAILKLFGDTLEGIEDDVQKVLGAREIEKNIQAIHIGYQKVEVAFAKKVSPEVTENMTEQEPDETLHQLLVSGNDAIAMGAIASGLTFFAGYPMSPATPIMDTLATYQTRAGLVVEQAEDEIGAVNMALGASYAGAVAMTATTGGGFSLMTEALGFAGIAEIPIVIVNVQRPGPATGLPTRTEQGDLKFMLSAAQGEFPRMVIAVKHHEDAFYQTVRAFYLAEKYQLPVILMSDQYLGEGMSTVPRFDMAQSKASLMAKQMNKVTLRETTASNQEMDARSTGPTKYKRYQLTQNGISPRYIPGNAEHLVCIDSDEHDEYGNITESAEIRTAMVDKRMAKLELLTTELIEPEVIGNENADIVFLCWGSIWGPMKEALDIMMKAGYPSVGALVFSDIYPLPTKTLYAQTAQAKRIINVEQNKTGQLAGWIREATGIACHGSILKYDGRQLSAADILAGAKPFLIWDTLPDDADSTVDPTTISELFAERGR